MRSQRDTVLVLEQVSVDVGDEQSPTRILQDLNLTVREGESLSIVGASGSGKTTLLSAIAGYLKPAAGRISFRGADVRGPDPARTMIFQTSTLFPWLTVSQNLRFSSAMRKLPREEQRKKEQVLLERAGVPGTEALYPSQLSVGMAERVEVARALANSPDLLLMDEPFSGVDTLTRESIRSWFGQFSRALEMTVIMVNHDISEAILMSDRIAVLRSRPAAIQAVISVPFAWPREPELVGEREFQSLRRSVLDQLGIDYRERAGAPSANSPTGRFI